ncbi:ABC transporter substrate-binding protein [Catellatospora paridis]|uniref:ABC transporter substrate-binding protein n=1 Tax=Catellatospora paridis TaxID=1617086 RepID=UPI0018AFE54C|nr:ABC transporter substrate-binding protein [Catellatospora paridis]
MDGLDRRRLLGLLTGVGVAGVTGGLAGCSSAGTPSERSGVSIGLLVPATGANKEVGADLELGFKLYLDLHDGKLGGRTVRIEVEDEGESTKSGAAALENLYKAQVLAVVGVANPDLLPFIRDRVEEAKVPLLAAHASPAEMPSAPYIWRTSYLTDEPALAIAHYLRRRLGNGSERVSLITVPGTAGAELMLGFTSVYGSGSQDVITVKSGIKPTTGDYAQYAGQIAEKHPAAIFCNLPSSHIVKFMDALSQAGLKPGRDVELYAPGSIAEGGALDELTDGARGLFTAMHYSADLNNLANHTFSSLFQAKFQRSPTAFAVAAYDAAAVLDQALTLAGDGTLSAPKVNTLLSNVGQVISPRGNWQFNQQRSPQQKWYLRKVEKDGPILSNVLISDLATLG